MINMGKDKTMVPQIFHLARRGRRVGIPGVPGFSSIGGKIYRKPWVVPMEYKENPWFPVIFPLN